jgi:hypothetical protein
VIAITSFGKLSSLDVLFGTVYLLFAEGARWPLEFSGKSGIAVGLRWMIFADNNPVKTGIIGVDALRFEQAAANYVAAHRDRNRIEITYPDIFIPIRESNRNQFNGPRNRAARAADTDA